MQPNSNSSFIPKKTINRSGRVRKGSRFYILTYVAYSVFFGTLLVVAGLFFYSQFLTNQLATNIAELEAQRLIFSQSSIERVKEVERQLAIIEYLFYTHASPYQVLSDIEKIAVDGITYKSFGYKRNDESDNIELTFTGGSDTFDAVVFQNNIFANASVMVSPEFTALTKLGEDQESENKTSETEPTSPVSFTVNKTITFDDIQFDQGVYEELLFDTIGGGIPGGDTVLVDPLATDNAEDGVDTSNTSETSNIE